MKMEITLKFETVAFYDSQGGQRIGFDIPAGTKIMVPSEWIYSGFPKKLEAKEAK